MLSFPEFTVDPPRGAHVRHFLYATTTLSREQFRLRYFGSTLGYIWTLLRPLAVFAILYVALTQILRFGRDIDHYIVLLILGLTLHGFFAESTTTALGSLVSRHSFLRKVSFPRTAIPVSSAVTAAANLSLSLVVVLLIALVDGVTLGPEWLYLIPVVMGVLIYGVATSLVLSILYVRFRDVKPAWEIGTIFLFWATPIIYPIEFVPERFREYMMYNPMAAAIQQTRHWIIDPAALTAADVLGSRTKLVIPAGIVVLMFAAGLMLFRVYGSRAEEL